MRLIAILYLSLVFVSSSIPSPVYADDDNITVMTQNQYLGADLTSIVAAPNPYAFNQAVLAALAQIKANNFPERAKFLAKAIAERRPAVVGLQEVFNFQLNGKNGAPPYRDHLTDTLKALANLGARYVVAASVRNLNLTLPVDFTNDGAPDAAVTVLDRDVILVRADVAATAVPFSQFCAVPASDGGPGCHYQTIAQANTAAGPIAIKRGFIGVDVSLEDEKYRVVNTHLEVQQPDPTNPLSPAIQAAQMQELLAVLNATTPSNRALIILGDINSSPTDHIQTVGPLTIVPPYRQLTGAGFIDAWTLRPGNLPGFTCCQRPDLLNHQSILNERVDVIFFEEEPEDVKVRVVGEKISDKTRPSRLWPSDHAAVAAEWESD